jgi:hypothetical protein
MNDKLEEKKINHKSRSENLTQALSSRELKEKKH